MSPERFRRIADLTRDFRSTTIRNCQSVEGLAAGGREFASGEPSELRARTMSADESSGEMFTLEPRERWPMPAGAFARRGGPS